MRRVWRGVRERGEELANEGSLAFSLSADSRRPEVFGDSLPARFNAVSAGGVTVAVSKDRDGVITAIVTGPTSHAWTLQGRAPAPRADDLYVGISWSGTSMQLFLNGDLVATAEPVKVRAERTRQSR